MGEEDNSVLGEEENDFVLLSEESSGSEDSSLYPDGEESPSSEEGANSHSDEELPAVVSRSIPEEEENPTLEITQALLAARQESDANEEVTPGGPEESESPSSALEASDRIS